MKEFINSFIFIIVLLFGVNAFAITSGTYSIGSGLDYDTVTAFEAAITGTLTGNLTGEHADEETTISTDVIFDISTSTYWLKLTAASGAEHDGTAYGNGARIDMTGNDSITLDEASADTLDRVEISNLAFDCTGSSNDGIRVVDGGEVQVLINRCLFAGNSGSDDAIDIQAAGKVVDVRNCIIYGFSAAGSLAISNPGNIGAATDRSFCNNSIMKNTVGLDIADTTINASAVFDIENNLFQGNTTAYDVSDSTPPSGFTTSKNYCEDATSPDSLQETFHDGTSNFVDYANDNFLIDSGGDSLANLADGTDLTGTFTDDIVDNTRTAADFFIGASWIDIGGGGDPPFIPRITISGLINRLNNFVSCLYRER